MKATAPSSPADRRKRLLHAGYMPLPVNGKSPPLKAWSQKTQTNDGEIDLWSQLFPAARSTGLLTEKLPTLDLDILDEQAVEAAEAFVRERFEERGPILVRIGLAPKRAIPFRTNDPFKKILVNLIAPNGAEGQKVEFLADGQQLVAFGLHEDTGKPYRWFGGEPGEVTREELPYIHEAEARQLVDDVADLLCHDFGYHRGKERPKNQRQANGGSADWGFLVENIRARRELHDSLRDLSAKLVRSGMDAGAAVNFLRGLMDETPESERDQRWRDRRGEIPRLVESATEAKEHSKSIILTNARFVSQFEPPDYLIDGIIQRRFLYALTGPTNAGKTAAALRLAAHIAPGAPLGAREVAKGKVLFLAGENPDDVRMRWIKLCEETAIGPAAENLFWVDGRLSISAMRQRLNTETSQHGPFNLAIIDSAAAFFEGDDENNNSQYGNYARMLRTLIAISGGPSILVLCHPIKNFSLDNLLPRGGGAFLNELDSNLVLVPISETPKVSELHWHAKHRGPDFAPISFKLTPGTSDKIKDSKGRLIWTVTAAPLTRDEVDAAESVGARRQEELLAAMQREPGASLAKLAEACGWTYASGEPNKSLVNRTMADLEKRKLVKLKDGHWTVVRKGQKHAKNA